LLLFGKKCNGWVTVYFSSRFYHIEFLIAFNAGNFSVILLRQLIAFLRLYWQMPPTILQFFLSRLCRI
jgi:hypothetical protein